MEVIPSEGSGTTFVRELEAVKSPPRKCLTRKKRLIVKVKHSSDKVMVPSPDGYHWMTEGGRYYLMKHDGEYKAHDGSALELPFKVKKSHS